jgi:hypothetical protein
VRVRSWGSGQRKAVSSRVECEGPSPQLWVLQETVLVAIQMGLASAPPKVTETVAVTQDDW